VAEPKRVFLHIGAPKTGTTYLQKVLANNRDAMEAAGVLYPRVGREAHHSAVWSVRGTFADTDKGATFADHWTRLVRQSRAWTGHTVVISSELFCFSRRRKIAEIVGAFEGAQVHIVYTARDLMRQVPAVWQEQVKNREVMTYRDYLADVLGRRRSPLATMFWNSQDVPDVLRRWSRGLDPACVHLVTAPPAGAPADLLWRRFATVVGLQADAYPSGLPAANTSLSITAAETLRRFNVRHAADLPILDYRRLVRRRLDPAFAATLQDGSKLPLTPPERDAIVDLSEQMVRRLRRTGYDVVGSLDELVPQRPDGAGSPAGRGPDDLTDSELVDALTDVLDYLLRRPR
jgi:hypothetical protein